MSDPPIERLALGLSYRGSAYQGWQSQPGGRTVQDRVEAALRAFAAQPIRTHCAGRTDAGVHALNQVVHIDAPVRREAHAWVRGSNRYLDGHIAVQWCQPVADDFHARRSALGRRYRYVLLQSPVRPALEHGLCGWTMHALNGHAMREAAERLRGEHDFSSFRAAECQALSPVKTLRALAIEQRCAFRGVYWHFDFDADAFLHHMVRNIMGCLVAVGRGRRPVAWIDEVLTARNRAAAAPTFAPDGLYFVGPYYDARHAIPEPAAAPHWMS